jgi:peptide/nickel transport system substrate-binding protein
MQRGRVVVLFAVAVVVAACASPPESATPAPSQPGAAAQPTAPKRITAAIRGDPKTMNEPINMAAGGSSSAGVRELEQLLNTGLLLLDPQGQLRPQLAEAVPTLENGLWKLQPDGRMEMTWRLKPNLQWQDGTPLTTDDLVFTSTIGRDKSLAMSQDQAYQFVDTVEAVDPQTLRVTWKSTFVDGDKLFTQTTDNRLAPLPKHLLEPAYLEDKTTFVNSPHFGAEYVGAGPYRLKEWVLGSHVILEANDSYVLGRPKIDQIEVKFILDTNTMVSNLLAGAVQLTIGRGLTPEQAITVREQWKEGVVDAGLQNTTSLYPQFVDASPPILTDARFRRALLMGLDRQQMVDTFLGGLVPVAHSVVSPDDPEYRDVDASVVKYDYDPRRAMELIDSIGLTKGSDGFYQDASGGRLTVEVRTRTHDLREKIQQVIADQWSKIGVVGQPLVIPEQRINDRVYQSTFPGFYFRFGNWTQLSQWRSQETPLPANNYVGQNIIRYQNPEYDALIGRFVGTIPRAERMQVMGQMVNFSTDQLLLLTLYHEPEPVLISNRMVNAAGRRGTNIQTWNAQEWDLKT